MARINKTWFYHVPGDKYRRQFNQGETCPPNLIDAALEAGVIDPPEPAAKPKKAKKAPKKSAEPVAQAENEGGDSEEG